MKKIKLITIFPPTEPEGAIENHYGVPFVVTDGELVAELPDGEADLMIDAGRAAELSSEPAKTVDEMKAFLADHAVAFDVKIKKKDLIVLYNAEVKKDAE